MELSGFKGDNRPVEQVSWYDATEFCKRLSRHTGHDYQLPTEAQWEYACRAGTTTPFHFGETISPELSNYRSSVAYNLGPTAQIRNETIVVGGLSVANAFGLSDMHGNVWEWCADHWHRNYEGAPVDGSPWLTNDDESNRLLRGGSWNNSPRYCRAATRNYPRPNDRDINFGFRVCCLAPKTLQSPTN